MKTFTLTSPFGVTLQHVDGRLQVENDFTRYAMNITPKQATNLASSLMQYATKHPEAFRDE